ncbi:LuxR C-terminal-related transcriptional regulator [Gemmobacter serpentinus]|uniref:LuxR C-terminal-related transcriptional regulator n=1 Tax=Gemmobacter serpentinus TaxID=2652247 RepID=UPI00124F5393|nr:response regulator transcription factor [Gemmobacter serpentinus]
MQSSGSADGSAIRLLIADDHDLVRDLVAEHLTVQGEFEVVTANSLAAARLSLSREGPFDVVLLDYALPDSSGLGDLAALVTEAGEAKVVLFSGQARPEVVQEALRRGFRGYIPKSTPARALAEALRHVRAGAIWLPEGFEPAAARPSPLESLTPREMEVLQAIRAGAMNKEIAARMAISEVTVKMHVRSICGKLRARNRTQAAMIASELLA